MGDIFGHCFYFRTGICGTTCYQALVSLVEYQECITMVKVHARIYIIYIQNTHQRVIFMVGRHVDISNPNPLKRNLTLVVSARNDTYIKL